jgi:hypothetical protein
LYDVKEAADGLYAQSDFVTTAPVFVGADSVELTGNDTYSIFARLMNTARAVFRIQFSFYMGECQLRASLVNDAAKWSNSDWISISDTVHTVELDRQAAKTEGINDGSLAFWINNVPKVRLTESDNNTQHIDGIKLGAVAGVNSNSRGTYFFDAFESSHRSLTALGCGIRGQVHLFLPAIQQQQL